MQNITSITGLKDAIKLLEEEQVLKASLLKAQLFLTYDSLKPVNLLMNTFKDISSSPHLINNISGTVMGLAGGFISKKMFVGTSGNLIRKLIGSILQFGITNVVAQNSVIIKTAGQVLFQHFLRKKNMKS